MVSEPPAQICFVHGRVHLDLRKFLQGNSRLLSSQEMWKLFSQQTAAAQKFASVFINNFFYPFFFFLSTDISVLFEVVGRVLKPIPSASGRRQGSSPNVSPAGTSHCSPDTFQVLVCTAA